MFKEWSTGWITVEFGGAGELVQPQEEWMDAEGMGLGAAGAMTTIMPFNSGVDVIMETSKVVEGPWRKLWDRNSALPAPYTDFGADTNAPDNPNATDHYIRLRFTATGAASCCFCVNMIGKG